MVLDLGKGGLFGVRGLEQETGLLKDRWAQDGSQIVNVLGGSAAGTEYTVTAGKRLFITNLVATETGASTNAVNLSDGGAGGTIVIGIEIPANGTVQASFTTPVIFDTDVYSAAAGTYFLTLTGWEERYP